jgi:hypothetical protein
MNTTEHWIKSLVFFIPRQLANLLSALAMGEQGWSLKKILALYSTWVAADLSEKQIAPNNVLILVLLWLVYAGILVGIYSIKDITDAAAKIKGTNPPNEPTKPETPQV